MPAAAITAAVRGTLQPTAASSLDELGNLHTLRLARGPPLGGGHELAKHAVNPKLIPNTHIISDDRGMMLARSESPEARQLLELETQHMLRPTRDLLLGVGNKQVTPEMNPLPAICTGG